MFYEVNKFLLCHVGMLVSMCRLQTLSKESYARMTTGMKICKTQAMGFSSKTELASRMKLSPKPMKKLSTEIEFKRGMDFSNDDSEIR